MRKIVSEIKILIFFHFPVGICLYSYPHPILALEYDLQLYGIFVHLLAYASRPRTVVGAQECYSVEEGQTPVSAPGYCSSAHDWERDWKELSLSLSIQIATETG